MRGLKPAVPVFLLFLSGLGAGGAFAQATWTVRNPSTPQATFRSVTWTGANLAVAVGNSGEIATSPDGSAWTSRASGTTNTLSAVVSNGAAGGSGRVVAVGTAGTIVTSSNGTTGWAALTPVTPRPLFGVNWTGSLFVAVGDSGTIITSSNGTTNWTSRTSNTGQPLYAVASGGGMVVAVGDSGVVVTATTGTGTWTRRVSGVTSALFAVHWAGNQFIAGGVGGVILASSDGIAWAPRVSGTGEFIASLTRSGSLWTAVGNAGVIRTSTDGVTWDTRVSGTAQSLRGVTWAGNRFVAVGVNGEFLTSTDGIAWTRVTSSTSALIGVAWGISRYVAVGIGGAIVTSMDGNTWTARVSGTSASLTSVSDNGIRFVAVGENGVILTSTDAITWAARPSGTTQRFNFVRWGGDRFVAVGNEGVIATSPDGLDWTLRGSGTANGLYSAVWTGNQYFVTGAAGTILASSDGNFWASRTSGFNGTLYAVRWTGSRLVAVGAGGAVLLSADGSYWESQSAGTTQGLFALAWTGSRLVAAGASGTVVTSPNGVTWDAQVSGTIASLNAMDWTGSQFVAVGPGGLVLTSPPAALTAAPAAPVPSSPAHNATGVSVNVNPNWSSTGTGSTYRIQVATNPSFATTIRDDSGFTTNLRAIGPLAANTVYYWRVRAKLNGYSSYWSETQAFSTGTLAAPQPTAPAQGATGVPLTTTLGWATVSGAQTYRVQLSTEPAFNGVMLDDSTLTAGSRVAFGLSTNTVYYWRVNAKNASGTSAWSSVQSFTTVATPPPAPILSVPAQNAVSVSVFTHFTWNASAGATGYRLQVSTDSAFGSSASLVIHDSLLTGITRSGGQIQLAGGTVYFWRVQARNLVGAGAWSAVGRFTTGPAPVAPPAAPVLIAPAQFASGIPVSTTFSWNAASGAATYRIQVSTNAGFSSVLVDDSLLTSTQRTITLAGNTVYFWQVSARNSFGYGPWSETWTFTTVTTVPTAAPALISPAQFTTGVSVPAPLTWGSVNGAATYRVQVSATTDFATLAFENQNVSGTTVPATGLLGSTDYYWRAAARNTAGTGPYSATWKFTTGAVPPPGIPVLVAPAQFATGVQPAEILAWEAVSGASTYQVQVSLSPAFSPNAVNDSNLTAVTRTIGTSLQLGETYYWRVRARNASGPGEWSTTWRFGMSTTSLLPGRVSLRRAQGASDGEIRFSLAHRARVVVRLHDLQGRLVAGLMDAEQEAGDHSITLPKDSEGSLRLIEIRLGDFRQTLILPP